MKWPLMFRYRHEVFKEALIANLDVRAELIEHLKRLIAKKDQEILTMKAIQEAKKCNDYTPEAENKRKMAEPVFSGRSGWRTRAQMMSEATIPVVGDSAKQLEAKVKKEGGTI